MAYICDIRPKNEKKKGRAGEPLQQKKKLNKFIFNLFNFRSIGFPSPFLNTPLRLFLTV